MAGAPSRTGLKRAAANNPLASETMRHWMRLVVARRMLQVLAGPLRQPRG